MQSKQTNPTAPANKVISKWRTFVSLNDRVKNMNTILPLISQLHSPFMQDRHWKKLMRVTEQHIDHASPKFCLEDLIKLPKIKLRINERKMRDQYAKLKYKESKLDKRESEIK